MNTYERTICALAQNTRTDRASLGRRTTKLVSVGGPATPKPVLSSRPGSTIRRGFILLALIPVLLLAAASLSAQAAATPVPAAGADKASRQITDMAGRVLTIPAKVNKVYSLNPIGTVAVYTLNPGKLAALNNPPGPGEKRFLTDTYLKLPVWGMATGGHGNVNTEMLIAGHPDVIFSSPLEPSQIEAARKIQDATGIPVVMLDQNLVHFDAFYLLLGQILGEEERAKILLAYVKKSLDRAQNLAKTALAKGIKVYYAEGADGLLTDPAGSFHTQVLDLLGGVNVAQVPKNSQAGGMVGMSPISFEQLASWQPEVIIASGNPLAGANGGTVQAILGDARWQTLKAVKNHQVYRIPSAPFDWFDRPPSSARLLGLAWLAQVLYPKEAKLDLRAETKEFYSLFYHVELKDADVDELLKGALP